MRSTARFVGAYARQSLKILVEYRANFLAQVFAMTLNNGLCLAFWTIYFGQFPVVRGWTLTDLLCLYAVECGSVGIVWGFFENALTIPTLAVQGGLDYFLVMPRSPLLHLSISRMSPFHATDVLFGLALFFLGCAPTWSRTAAFALMLLLACVLWYGFMVFVGSLCFFVGTSQAGADQIRLFLLHFSSYPGDVFGPKTRLVLLSLLPSILLTTMPVEFVRAPAWPPLLALGGGAATFLVLGVVTFRLGLKRYESGNGMALRG